MSTTPSSYTVTVSGESFVIDNIVDGVECIYHINCVDKKDIEVTAGILKEMPGLVAANFADGPSKHLYFTIDDATYDNMSKIVNYLKYVGNNYNYDHLYMTEEEETKWKETEMAKVKQSNVNNDKPTHKRPLVDFGTRKPKEYPQALEDTKSMDYMANILAPNAKVGEEIKLEDTDQVYSDMLFKLADSLGCSLFRDYSLAFVTRLVQRTNLAGKFNDEADKRVINHFNYADRYKGVTPLVHEQDIIDVTKLPSKEEIEAIRKQYAWVWWQDQMGSKMVDAQVFNPIEL